MMRRRMSGIGYDMVYKIGIVGTGGIAHAHGKAAQDIDEVELTAICDVSQESLDRYGDHFGVKRRYQDLETMLVREDLDFVVICTWGNSHAEISNRIAHSRRVKAILCEKPICSTAAECEEMITVAKDNGILLAEAFKFRHHPRHLKVKELIDSGLIGDVTLIRSTFTGVGNPVQMTADRNWRFNKEKGGGAVYDLGCYCIHHARFMIGAEPFRVYASGHKGKYNEINEAVAIQLEFPDEISTQIAIAFRYFGSQEAEIYGTDGYIRTDLAWNNENQPVSLEVKLKNGDRRTYDFAAVDQFALQLQHMCACLETGQAQRISPENSLGQMQVIDAVHASIASGKPVELQRSSTSTPSPSANRLTKA